jgi:hypothetical protein
MKCRSETKALLAAGRRRIFLTLAPIGERQRRSEAEFWRDFDLARPRILGALLDAAGRGLQTFA